MIEELKTARRAVTRHARAAERAGFDAHEAPLTEILLTRVSPPVRVVKFTQREEALTGSDWLWWWRGAREWFGTLVQAKRNKPRNQLPWYDFGYQTSGGSRQIDRLLASAHALRVPAIYALYNYPRIARRVAVGSQCCHSPTESWRTRLQVAALPALVANVLIGREDSAPQFAFPIECLTCSARRLRLLAPVRNGIGDAKLLNFLDGQPATVARTVARRLLAEIAITRLGEFRRASPVEAPRTVSRDEEVFQDLPDDRGHLAEPYFDHVLRGLRRQPPWYVSALLNGARSDDLASDLPNVAGIVIVDDTPGEEVQQAHRTDRF